MQDLKIQLKKRLDKIEQEIEQQELLLKKLHRIETQRQKMYVEQMERLTKMYTSQFDIKLEKVTKTISDTLSIHKSSYKGLMAFYKELSDIQQTYSNSLLKLSKTGGDYIGLKFSLPDCVKQETEVVKIIMQELLYNFKTLSQLRFNFCERLKQTLDSYNKDYEMIKKKKDEFMHNLQEIYPDFLKNNVNQRQLQEKRISKGMYGLLHFVEEYEGSRVQKIRQQTIILYAHHKKVVDKQGQIMKSSAARLSKMDTEYSLKSIHQLLDQVIVMHNKYPGEDKIERKAEYKSVNRESLKNTILASSNQASKLRIEANLNKLKQLEQHNENIHLESVLPEQYTKYSERIGLLSKGLKNFKNYNQYVNPKLLNKLAYQMFESYYLDKIGDTDVKYMLVGVKVRMSIDNIKSNQKCNNWQEFLEKVYPSMSPEEQAYMGILFKFNSYYSNKISEDELRKALSAHDAVEIKGDFDQWLLAVILDSLLQTLFLFKTKSPALIGNYSEIFKCICDFTFNFLSTQPHLPLVLLIQKILRSYEYRNAYDVGQNIVELEDLNQIVLQLGYQIPFSPITIYYKTTIKNNIINKLLYCYKIENRPQLYIQVLHWLEKLFKEEQTSQDLILQTLQVSGYHYITEKDEDKCLFRKNFEDAEKLKSVTNVVKSNEFLKIDKNCLKVIAECVEKQYNIGYEAALKQIRKRFLAIINRIIIINLQTINMDTFQDRDGYVLVLGVEICKIDQLSNHNITYYDHYFRLLKKSFEGMERLYKDLLQQTKSTETWLILENQSLFATQNCYDFCTLLCKPIEFMINTLKELVDIDKSDFKNKFITQIKLRLNTIIQKQLVEYVKFLYDSLDKITVAPPKVMFEPPKYDKLIDQNIERNLALINEMFKRLTNIVFVKQQSNNIVKDLMGESADNIKDFYETDLLIKEIEVAQNNNKQLLQILLLIAKEILTYEDKIKLKIGRGIVLTYLKGFFQNLYFRVEKGAIQEFFSTNSKVDMSEHTFMKNQDVIDSLLDLVRRNVPAECYHEIYAQFMDTLYLCTKCQILNSNKFRLPVEKETVYDFLNKDIGNLVTLIKQKERDEPRILQIIDKHFYLPIRAVLELIREDSSRVIAKFEEATMNKRVDQSNQLICLLNLRAADKKTKEFVKKYKTKK